MANPYTSQVISGYNSAAPPDDGTQVSSNEITWAKHKDKLADPVKTLAESMNTETLAAFGLIFGQGILEKSGDYTVIEADRGNFFSVTGTTTITLLAAATAGAGFPLAIINNGSGVVTVDGNGAETINGDATVDLQPDDFIILTCNASLWIGLTNKSQPDVSGYVKGTTVYLEEDVAANSTLLEIIAIISSAFESIGPTGSGATNIWTAMDDIPSGAKWIAFKTLADGGAGIVGLHGRKTGSGIGVSTPRTLLVSGDFSAYAKITLDSSNRFDLYRIGAPTTCYIALIEWGI